MNYIYALIEILLESFELRLQMVQILTQLATLQYVWDLLLLRKCCQYVWFIDKQTRLQTSISEGWPMLHEGLHTHTHTHTLP